MPGLSSMKTISKLEKGIYLYRALLDTKKTEQTLGIKSNFWKDEFKIIVSKIYENANEEKLFN